MDQRKILDYHDVQKVKFRITWTNTVVTKGKCIKNQKVHLILTENQGHGNFFRERKKHKKRTQWTSVKTLRGNKS